MSSGINKLPEGRMTTFLGNKPSLNVQSMTGGGTECTCWHDDNMISLVLWTVIVIFFELGGSLNVTNETSAGQLLTNVVPCSTRQ